VIVNALVVSNSWKNKFNEREKRMEVKLSFIVLDDDNY